ncbi:MAG TPA: alpha-amylase family glycosyl hydrolase [Egibacteraceae bacterium]|nr:alpha-amylase family glycosyl hydrolase [Egibacteraceae bacterium]
MAHEVVEAGAASARPGMGALPYEGGVAFRVWAPFADAVWAAGDFNDWSASGAPLAPEGNGYWSADVGGALVGHEYKFVVRRGDELWWRNDPYARDVTSSVGNSIVYDPGFDWGEDGYVAPAWHDLVVYEIHVGSFNDEPGGGPGSFTSVANRLDYLRDLGVSAIELMPSAEFATDFSWGYNPAHIFAIEEAYGGPDALKHLVRAAHERGLAVLFDVVYNHLGPSDLDLWRFDGWSENGKGGIYFYNDHRSQTPWGDTRPDYGREEVCRFLSDNARMWLEEFRFDGLRWDATSYIRNVYGNDGDPGSDIPEGWALMQRITGVTAERQPWKLHIAEDLRGNDWVTRETSAGGAGFATQWDGEFVHPVRRVLSAAFDSGRDLRALERAVSHRYGGDALRRVIYTESHDEVANGKSRLPEEIWPGNADSWHARKRSTLGAVLVFTSPGIPMIFQGQEIHEDAWFHDQDPIDWTKEQTNEGIVRLYRDLIRLRRNWYDTTRGLRGQHVAVHHLNDVDNVMAFHRWDRGGPRDDVIVVVNVSHRSYDSYPIGLPQGGTWRVRFNSDWDGYSDDFGSQHSYDTTADGAAQDGMPHSGNVGLSPYSAIILSQD